MFERRVSSGLRSAIPGRAAIHLRHPAMLALAGLLALLAEASCSPSMHNWYYAATASDGSHINVLACVNSTGGLDSPGLVASAWKSETYSAPGGEVPSPLEIKAAATVPGESVMVEIYEDGVRIQQAAASAGSLAVANCIP